MEHHRQFRPTKADEYAAVMVVLLMDNRLRAEQRMAGLVFMCMAEMSQTRADAMLNGYYTVDRVRWTPLGEDD
jgi:hypothetical protein